MGKPTARKRLAANLKALMDAPGSRYPSAPAVAKAAAAKGGKITRSTVQRIRDETNPANIDFVDELAKVFNVEPWQLLADDLGRGMSESSAPPDLARSLAGLGANLQRVPSNFHAAVGAMLQSLVSEPRTHRLIHASLQPLVDAGEALAMVGEVEGDDFDEQEKRPSPKAKPPVASKAGGRKIKAPIYYGDGNKSQGKLPFPLRPREELARSRYEPSEDERKLWARIEAYPKARS